ncbi:C40 family peptidase [Streptomyces sp. P38-E01]|uniref:C40 family peptidase n=1 Tax=Streptomyces tardus TaxID=2780544 RepID=A0A949JF18_9ACTN|nr:C40 family peptidase [Streptomyces tardus]MBU7598898.1 C40 family peptidase [Streptomyces tardus]
MKALVATIGFVCLIPVLLGGGAMMLAGSSDATAMSARWQCMPGDGSEKIADQVADILDGADASDVRIKDLPLPDEQVPHAQTIVATGISLEVPRRGQIVALATAMQESRLRNLNYGDRDSLGLFQQRPSQGWGTSEQVRDPVYASTRFYKGLLAVAGWQQMTVTQAAQAVQRSGYPDAYAQWEPLATALQKAIAATFPGSGEPPEDSSCDAASFDDIPEGKAPKGYSVPGGTTPRARTAIVWAMHQLGTPYQWGGSCTDADGPDPMARCDCSSLTQQSYKQAGIALTRTSQTQVRDGDAVSRKSLRPGDLVFSRGSAAAPEHVALYLGRGLVIEAPRTGKPVRVVPLATLDVLTARRVT